MAVSGDKLWHPCSPDEQTDSQFAQIRLSLQDAIQNHARDRLRGCLPERDRDR